MGWVEVVKSRVVLVAVVLVTVLALSAGTAVGWTADPMGSDGFGDVPVGYWADGEVGWAVANGFSRGVGGGRFGLDGAVTRAQIVSSVYRTVRFLQGVASGLEGTIVFESQRNGYWDVFVMNADGTDQRQLTDNTSEDRSPSWSPDGTRIVFNSDRDGYWDVFVMNADGTDQRQLTDNTSEDRSPAWSPDGTRIVFESDRDGYWDVFVMNADGTDQQQLTDNGNYDGVPGWSPDGTRIAFTSDRDGDYEIFVMEADGTGQQQITNNTSADWSPSWSPDGTRIVFASDRDGEFEVFVMEADGTGQRQITNNTSTDLGPSWSPDGTRIVFASDRDGEFEVFVMNADGTNQQQLTSNFDTEFVYGLAWWSQAPSLGSDLFEDVPEGHFAEDAIRWAAEEEITVGVGNNQFGIGQTLNRYEMVTFLCRAFSPDVCRSGTRGSDTFGDVPVDHWANYAIGWAVENGITSGVSATEFGGPQTLKREQIAAFLWRGKGSVAGGSLGSDVYTDVPADRSHWANQPIGWAYDQGISGGIASGTFGFGTSLTREEMVLFLCRALASDTCTPSQTPKPPSGADTVPPTTIVPEDIGPGQPDLTMCRPMGTSGITAGFPLPSWAMPSVGSIQVAVLFVDFPDIPATRSPDDEAEIFLPFAEEYLESVSYGKLDLEFVLLRRWLRVENNHDFYLTEGRLGIGSSINGEVARLADPEFDFTGYEGIMIVMPGSHFTGGNALGSSETDEGTITTVRMNTFVSDSFWDQGRVAAHELAHHFGLLDFYPYDASVHQRPPAPEGKIWAHNRIGLMSLQFNFLTDPQDSRLAFESRLSDGSSYTNYNFSLEAFEMLAWSRWQLGWLDQTQIRCVTESETTVSLSPVADPEDGIVMVAVPLSQTELIVIESRRKIGYDAARELQDGNGDVVNVPALATEGVLVYTVNAALGTGQLPVNIAGDTGNGQVDTYPLLTDGQSVTIRGYTITVKSSTSTTHTVTITKAP